MRLTIVGCSGSVSAPDSASSCYLLQAGQPGDVTTVVLDLGSGGFGQMLRYVRPEEIDAVALSHLHADHVVDMVSLDVYLRFGPGGPYPQVPVWGPDGTAERLESLCGEAGGGRDAFASHAWAPGEVVQIGPLRIEPFEVEHPVQAYALRITGPAEEGEGTRTLVFTGDTDSCDGVTAAAQGADLLLSEAAFIEGKDTVRGVHLTGRRAGELATATGAKHLVLTHIQPWNPAETVRAEATSAFQGRVDVAVPGVVYTL